MDRSERLALAARAHAAGIRAEEVERKTANVEGLEAAVDKAYQTLVKRYGSAAATPTRMRELYGLITKSCGMPAIDVLRLVQGMVEARAEANQEAARATAAMVTAMA